MEDSRIIQLYFERSEDAIKETQAKYESLCRGIARHILRSEADVEECVNDVYLGVWRAIPPAHPQNLSAFLCKITRNLALKKSDYNHAQKRTANVTVSFEELSEVLPDSRLQPDADAACLGSLISTFLRSEKELSRMVFLRKYWYFDSVAEIATRFSISESKVKILLFRTRNRLKDYLKKEGIYL